MSTNSNTSDESSTNTRTSRPTKHVVLKYSTGSGASTPLSEPKNRTKTVIRRKRTSAQLLEDQIEIRPTRQNTSLRRSSRHSIVHSEEDEEDSYNELKTSSPAPSGTTPPVQMPAASKPVGRPKGRPQRRKPTSSNGTSLRKSRRTTTAIKESVDISYNKDDEEDYDYLQHEIEVSNMKSEKSQLQSPIFRRAFDSIHMLYSINLDEEDAWRNTAENVAGYLDNLRGEWQALELKRKSLTGLR